MTPVGVGARHEIGDGQEVVSAHYRSAVLGVPAQRRVALALDERVGVGGVELDCGQGAQREGAATPPPVAAGFAEWREVKAVLCEEAVPYLYPNTATPMCSTTSKSSTGISSAPSKPGLFGRSGGLKLRVLGLRGVDHFHSDTEAGWIGSWRGSAWANGPSSSASPGKSVNDLRCPEETGPRARPGRH